MNLGCPMGLARWIRPRASRCGRGTIVMAYEQRIARPPNRSLPSLKMFAGRTNHRIPPTRIPCMSYFIVTFNAVVKPVFTVAEVLTLANPGAATVTV